MSTAVRVARGGLDKINLLVAAVLIGLLHVWRTLVSPLYGDVCRYYPSCSAYGLEAVKTHGPWRGSWLTARRLARCVPWAKTRGFDPVPTPKKSRRDPEDLVRVSADSPNRGA
ncbi:MAG: membrane protein insertion efficiency factor YidD [Actinomycetota bacterium]|nr:membrane protein insertion efficiency factor YidD [Actinomycetota bacterium]